METIMQKFLHSKNFVLISTAATFVISFVAVILLGFQPKSSGRVSSGFGRVDAEHVFQFRAALGYWLLGLVLTFAVYLLCVLVRAQILKDTKENGEIHNI